MKVLQALTNVDGLKMNIILEIDLIELDDFSPGAELLMKRSPVTENNPDFRSNHAGQAAIQMIKQQQPTQYADNGLSKKSFLPHSSDASKQTYQNLPSSNGEKEQSKSQL